MKKNKGFTLIEVILSLAVLGIISMAFLTGMSNHFTFLNKTKTITQDVFVAQSEMEKEIDNVKDQIRKNKLPLKDKIIFKDDLGGINVKYVEVEEEYANKEYYTLVSNIKPDLLKVIELESIDIKLNQGILESTNGYASGAFEILGKFKNKNEFKYDHLLNNVEWYVSSEEFNMPIPEGLDLENDILIDSYYYPIFPRDYILVSNSIINNFGTHERPFSELSSYSGRNIIFTATPGAKSGKIGKQGVSEPIFISGLPITDKLEIHLDAGFINFDPAYNNGVKKNGEMIEVIKWEDLSSVYGKKKPNEAAEVYGYEKPELKKTKMGVEFIGQYIKFIDGQFLEIRNQNTLNKPINIFAAVRNRKINEESIFLENGNNEFSIVAKEEELDPDWEILLRTEQSSSNAFKIGGKNVDIAEIAIYTGELSDTQVSKIEKYFVRKYIGEKIDEEN